MARVASGPLEERIGCAPVSLLALDVRFHSRDLHFQFIDILTQLSDPQSVKHKLLQANPLANRAFFLVYHPPPPSRAVQHKPCRTLDPPLTDCHIPAPAPATRVPPK